MFYALWVPDLFMKRVEEDGIWSLMCPNNCTGLQDCYGEEFEKLYERFVLDFIQLPYPSYITAVVLVVVTLASHLLTILCDNIYLD